MNIKYEKHERFPNSVFIRKFDGTVCVDEIIQSWIYLLENEMIGENTKGVINDLRNCELDMNMESFETLIQFLKQNKILKKLRLAVISEKPEIIVFPILGEYESKDLSVKPFSTEEAAINWIMYDQSV